MHFLVYNIVDFVSNSSKTCSKWFSQIYTSISLDNGLAPKCEKPLPELMLALFTVPFIRLSASVSLAMFVLNKLRKLRLIPSCSS